MVICHLLREPSSARDSHQQESSITRRGVAHRSRGGGRARAATAQDSGSQNPRASPLSRRPPTPRGPTSPMATASAVRLECGPHLKSTRSPTPSKRSGPRPTRRPGGTSGLGDPDAAEPSLVGETSARPPTSDGVWGPTATPERIEMANRGPLYVGQPKAVLRPLNPVRWTLSNLKRIPKARWAANLA